MIGGAYTRYELRLASAAVAPGPGGAAVDDWSGAAPVAAERPLDGRRADAFAELAALVPGGWEERPDGLVFWLPEGAERAPGVRAALARLAALGRLSVRREDADWQETWRRFHVPHVVGRVRVRPPWYPPEEGFVDVVVEAAMAFGTGGHASTRQCLAALQGLPRGSLLDVGTGSGVVALAALRLGFAPVWAVDVDPVAVQGAARNAARNGLQPTLLLGDATDPSFPLPATDVVVANIALGPIVRLAARWSPASGRDTAAPVPRPRHLLLAGLLVHQEDEALAAFPGCRLAGRDVEGEWLLLHLEDAP